MRNFTTNAANHLLRQADIHDTAAQHAHLTGDHDRAATLAGIRQVYDTAAAAVYALTGRPDTEETRRD